MIALRDVAFGYGREPLFNELTLDLKPGIYGLLGKNGAGKSSLLRIIAGLLYPQAGRVDALGYAPEGRPPELLRELFLVTEEFYLPSGMDLTAYVEMYRVFYPGFDLTLFKRCLEELELSWKTNLGRLSYGQRKKALLAFALAAGTRVVLLDEPTNGLDIPSKTSFRRLVAASWNEERCFIISTHQVKDVERLIEPVLILDQGRIVFNHTLEEAAQALEVRLSPTEPEGDEVLYREKTLGGWAALAPRSGEGGDAALDLELLFNGVLARGDQVNALFRDGPAGSREAPADALSAAAPTTITKEARHA